MLRRKEAATMLGVSVPTFWRYSKNPDFPVAFRLGPNAVGYAETEIEAWLESRRVVRPDLDSLPAAARNAGR
jgi:predicted DNA-binding transcriptional regulator AlpA